MKSPENSDKNPILPALIILPLEDFAGQSDVVPANHHSPNIDPHEFDTWMWMR